MIFNVIWKVSYKLVYVHEFNILLICSLGDRQNKFYLSYCCNPQDISRYMIILCVHDMCT